jgi:uracil permease
MTSVVLVTGLSGAFIRMGDIKMTGMSLGACVAMLMGLIFFIIDKLHIANDYTNDSETEE